MSDSPFGQVGFIHRILDVGDIFKFYSVMITPSYSLVFMHEHALAQVNMYPSRFLLTCCRDCALKSIVMDASLLYSKSFHLVSINYLLDMNEFAPRIPRRQASAKYYFIGYEIGRAHV